MSPLLRTSTYLRFGRTLLVLGLCATLGAHWVVLQTLAWTQMLVSYAQTETFPEAVKKTFDGAHPCDLCKLVQSGQHEEKKPASIISDLKWDAVLTVGRHLPTPAAERWCYPLLLGEAVVRCEGPPTPPPRA